MRRSTAWALCADGTVGHHGTHPLGFCLLGIQAAFKQHPAVSSSRPAGGAAPVVKGAQPHAIAARLDLLQVGGLDGAVLAYGDLIALPRAVVHHRQAAWPTAGGGPVLRVHESEPGRVRAGLGAGTGGGGASPVALVRVSGRGCRGILHACSLQGHLDRACAFVGCWRKLCSSSSSPVPRCRLSTFNRASTECIPAIGSTLRCSGGWTTETATGQQALDYREGVCVVSCETRMLKRRTDEWNEQSTAIFMGRPFA